jgi:hypothetical protein
MIEWGSFWTEHRRSGCIRGSIIASWDSFGVNGEF